MKRKKGRTWGGAVAGDVKMKGKPCIVMSCKCCVFYNRKRFPTEADLKKFENVLEAPENKF